MADDIVKSIKMKYSQTGLKEIRREVEHYNRATKEMVRYTEVDKGKGFTTISKTVVPASKAMGHFSSTLNSAMLRFIGLNAVISMGQKAFQEIKKFIDEGVQSFRSFEHRLAEVSSILDSTTREHLPAYAAGLSNLSIAFAQPIEDLTRGLYQIISAAFSVEDAMNLLNTVTKASIAGLTTVEGAVKTFTGVLNAYGLSAAHAAELSDKMFMAVVRGNFTFKDLESSLGYVVPIAANVGVAFDEIAASLTTATRQGQRIDSVTRGLGLLLQNIVDPTTQAAEAARKYGVDMSATALRVGGLTGFFEDLNEATSKYGTSILPELIGNMRSLRVAMALTGDVGLAGFKTDMELLETSTGRTEQALAEMMNTNKMMADILEQSMNKVKRSVGEAWSGFDIWWKKTELWWGTLFSGGDANKAVMDFEKSTSRIREAYLKNIVKPVVSGEKTLFDKLQEGANIKDVFPMEGLTQYLDVETDITKLSKESTALDHAKVAVEQLISTSKQMREMEFTVDEDNLAFKILNESLTELGLTNLKSNIHLRDLEKILAEVTSRANETALTLELLVSAEAELRPTVDQITTAFDNMTISITDTKASIITLMNEIRNIESGLANMRKELIIAQAESPFEKFQEYAGMASKYGSQYMNEWTNVFDAFGNSMGDAIKVIYEYNSALRETSKEELEAQKRAKDLQIAMAENNIQMLKLQLIGMIRRRGNTRAEQRQMKQLQIENTKLRIEEMQRQYDEEKKHGEEVNDEKEVAYQEAMEIFNRYVDMQRHGIWLLKDDRDADIKDLQDTIDEQTRLLNDRTEMLDGEYTKLNNMQTLYQESLLAMAADPELAEAYRAFTGQDALADARGEYESYLSFIQSNPLPGGVSPMTSAVAMPPSQFLEHVKSKFPLGGLRIPKLETGTDYVPSTGLYMLHKGEAVVPSGQAGGTSVVININNPMINNDYDVAKVARSIENVVRANLTDKRTGKSKYRMA